MPVLLEQRLRAYKDRLLSSKAVDIVHTAVVSGGACKLHAPSLENAGLTWQHYKVRACVGSPIFRQ